ncbi:M4 family metallopeptidase [Streptomyces buecherae]|uniref:M4 family metallopeptidase n=1 Tax=Streptomyces buecherae TaxID=2763006 RepID=UPI0036943220
MRDVARTVAVACRATFPVAALLLLAAHILLVVARAAGGRAQALAHLAGGGVDSAALLVAATTGGPLSWSAGHGASVSGELSSWAVLSHVPWFAAMSLLPLAAGLWTGYRAMVLAGQARVSGTAVVPVAVLMFVMLYGGLWTAGAAASDSLVRIWTRPLPAALALLAWTAPGAAVGAFLARRVGAHPVCTRPRRVPLLLVFALSSLTILGSAPVAVAEQAEKHRSIGADWHARAAQTKEAEAVLRREAAQAQAAGDEAANHPGGRGDPTGPRVSVAKDIRTGTSTSAVLDSPYPGDALRWVNAHQGLFGVSEPANFLRERPQVEKRQTRERQQHLWYDQVVDGVPVHDARVGVHLDESGQRVRMVSNGFRPDIAVPSTKPVISADEAVSQARRALPSARLVEKPTLYLHAGSPVQGRNTPADLVWEVWLSDQAAGVSSSYFVDASGGGGGVLLTENRRRHGLYREVYDLEHEKVFPPSPVLTEHSQPSHVTQDATVAFEALGVTYSYFHSMFGRDSYDGRGASLKAGVRFDRDYENAYWDPADKIMVFGDGMVIRDIAAHEMTHAVTSSSADLRYEHQSGALNESFSDIFGEATDRHVGGGDWVIGSQASKIGELRDLANPARYGQPGHMKDYEIKCGDGGGVHHNSGIPNRAFYLAYQKLGKKADRIFYHALTDYLFPSAGFADAVNATYAASWALYGKDGAEAGQIMDAWKAVGVDSDTPISKSKNCTCAVSASLGTAELDTTGADRAQIKAALYLARDVLPQMSPAVGYYVELYNEDYPLLTPLLLENPALNDEFSAVLQKLTPLFEDISGVGPPQTVTAEHIDAINHLMDGITEADRSNTGGGALAQSIQTQWRAPDYALLAGMGGDAALDALDDMVKRLS